MFISVVICSIGRKILFQTISSVLKNDYKYFEVIVILQNFPLSIQTKIKSSFPSNNVKFFSMNNYGKARGINFALKKCRGEVIAFTDDDCIVDKGWLKNIYLSFKKNLEISGIFGCVLPFHSYLKNNNGKVCPCVFLQKESKVIIKPCLHWKNIGFGNNMAFKQEVFKQIGNFKEWLGPGSIGSNAEDAEFALRLLLKGYKVLYNPKIKVYHNRWLTEIEFKKQFLSYLCGETACYGYFAFQGNNFAKPVVINNLKDRLKNINEALKSLIMLKKHAFQLLYQSIKELCFSFRGLLIGYFFSKKDPL